MRLPGVPYSPTYTSDEKVLGVVVALALHVVIIGPFIYRAIVPAAHDPADDEPLVSRPVVQAALMKLGKPIDPKKLPDRLIPQTRTAPKKQINASQEDPSKTKPDAGPPPPPAEDSYNTNLVTKSDPFAEDAGHKKPDEGVADGSDAGTETDPNKAHSGDAYAAALGAFFSQRLNVPTVISVGEERRLCSVYEVQLNRAMVIWYVRQAPVKSSGNELFDDAARSMLQKLLDDRTSLPEPPKDVADQYRNKRLQIVVTGKNGDASKCMTH